MIKECRDPDHVDVGPLSPLGDFYASSPNVCKACKKRHATVVQTRRRQARRDEGLPVCDVAYHDMIIRQRLKATYQHSASEEQPDPIEEQEEQDVVFLDQPEFRVESGFSSLTSLMPWLHQGKPKPKYSRA